MDLEAAKGGRGGWGGGGGGVGERRSLSTAKDYTLSAGVRKSEEREVGEGRGRQRTRRLQVYKIEKGGRC